MLMRPGRSGPAEVTMLMSPGRGGHADETKQRWLADGSWSLRMVPSRGVQGLLQPSPRCLGSPAEAWGLQPTPQWGVGAVPSPAIYSDTSSCPWKHAAPSAKESQKKDGRPGKLSHGSYDANSVIFPPPKQRKGVKES